MRVVLSSKTLVLNSMLPKQMLFVKQPVKGLKPLTGLTWATLAFNCTMQTITYLLTKYL